MGLVCSAILVLVLSTVITAAGNYLASHGERQAAADSNSDSRPICSIATR